MEHKDVDSFQTLYTSIREAKEAKDMDRLTELRRDLRVLAAFAEENESRLVESLEAKPVTVVDV